MSQIKNNLMETKIEKMPNNGIYFMQIYGLYFEFQNEWIPFGMAKKLFLGRWAVVFEPSIIANKFELSDEIREKAILREFYEHVDTERQALYELNAAMKSDIVNELKELIKANLV